MKDLFEKIYRKPILYGVLLMVAYFAISIPINHLLGLIPNELLHQIVFMIVQIGLCTALALWTKKKFGRGFTLGITHRHLFKSLFLLGPFYIILLFNGVPALTAILMMDPNASNSAIAQGVLTALVGGIRPGVVEELLCRVCIMGYLVYTWAENPNGLRKAVWVSAAIFGFSHIINALHVDLVSTLMQCMYATAMGALLGAVYARTHNLLALMLAHSFMDVLVDIPSSLPVLQEATQVAETASTAPNLASIIVYVVLSLIWGGWAMFLLRKKKLAKAPALWQPEALPAEA